MPLIFFCFLVAHVVYKAVWGAEKYIRENSRGVREKAAGFIERKAKTNPFEGDFKLGRLLAWFAAATAWLTGKTIKHGVGVGKAIKDAIVEGREEVDSIREWAKTEREIRRAHEEADEVNKRLDWEDLVRAREEDRPDDEYDPFAVPVKATPVDPEEFKAEREETPEIPVTPVVTPVVHTEKVYIIIPANSKQDDPEDVEVEVVNNRTAKTPPAGDDVVEAEIVDDPNPETNPVITSGTKPALEIEMSHSAPNTEVQGLPGARMILEQIKAILLQEQAQAEARLADAQRGAERLSQTRNAVASLIDGLQSYEMDHLTLGDAMVILDEVLNAEGAARRGAAEDSRAWEAMNNSVTATEATRLNMDARHGVLEQAHVNAPVKAGVRELYMDGQ